MQLNDGRSCIFPDGRKGKRGSGTRHAPCRSGASGRYRIYGVRALADCFGRTDLWFGGVVVSDGAAVRAKGFTPTIPTRI